MNKKDRKGYPVKYSTKVKIYEFRVEKINLVRVYFSIIWKAKT